MSYKKTDEGTRDEHAVIGGVAGKKTFVIDNAGNQIIDFVNPTSNVTVEQGTTPWTVANVGNVTVEQGDDPWTSSLIGNVTVHQGDTPWISQATITVFGDQTEPMAQDSLTNSLVVLDHSHHEVHKGNHFYVKGYVDLAQSTSTDFLWIVPDTTKWPHARWEVASEAEATFQLYENPTTPALGSAVTIWNSNRNSATAAGVTAYSTPSVTAVGALVYSAKTGSGRAVGGGTNTSNEFIGKQNTTYLFRLTNDDGSSTRWIGYNFYWYEE